jgi:Protein of unknown function (DUF1360)
MAVRDRLIRTARAQRERYAGGEDRPLKEYAATMAIYAGMVGTLAGLARATHREIPTRVSPMDLTLCAAATHKLSRLLAKDPVTSPLRAPFTEYEGNTGPAELHEEARGHGAQKAIGEMLTCPFCTGMWIATAFTAGLVYLPRTTRLAAATLTSLAGSDLLQFAYAWLEGKTQ